MARKTNLTPQPLTLPNPNNNLVDDDLDFIGSPKSPLSPKSPRSPRSPFRFSKRTQSELPSMQAAESQQTRTSTLSSSQTTPSLSASHYSGEGDAPADQKQKQERPAKSGFFSKSKASRSTNRLQNNPNTSQPDDRMSRDTDRPSMSGRVSSKENTRTGKTLLVRVSRYLGAIMLTVVANRIQG